MAHAQPDGQWCLCVRLANVRRATLLKPKVQVRHFRPGCIERAVCRWLAGQQQQLLAGNIAGGFACMPFHKT